MSVKDRTACVYHMFRMKSLNQLKINENSVLILAYLLNFLKAIDLYY